MGDIAIEVTYGKKIRASVGNEFSSWNLEALDIINTGFFSFWFVDIFHFCSFYRPLALGVNSRPNIQYALSQAGYQALTLGIHMILYLTSDTNEPSRRLGLRSTWLSNQIRYVAFEKAKELYV